MITWKWMADGEHAAINSKELQVSRHIILVCIHNKFYFSDVDYKINLKKGNKIFLNGFR